MRFEVTTHASPEQVREALTDFSDRRLQTWSRTLDPKRYELRDHGENWAVAREATPRSPFWVVARYDWSDPDGIRMAILESSYGGAGTGSFRITPRAGGGSRLSVEWDNTGARSWQKLLIVLMHRGPVGRLVCRMWTSALDRFAESHAPSTGAMCNRPEGCAREPTHTTRDRERTGPVPDSTCRRDRVLVDVPQAASSPLCEVPPIAR